MNVYKIADVVSDVRAVLNENRTSTTLISAADVDTLSLDEVIKNVILDAIESIHKTAAPKYLFEATEIPITTVKWDETLPGDGRIGWLMLEPDFMRLAVLKLSTWKYSVTDVVTQDDPKYDQFFSQYPGVAGNNERPKCCLASTEIEGDYGMWLGFTAKKNDGATVTLKRYLPIPSWNDDKLTVNICGACYRSVVYYAAGLTCLVLNAKDQAELYFTVARDLVNANHAN